MHSKASTEAKTEQWVSEFWNKNFAYSDIKQKNPVTFNTLRTKVFLGLPYHYFSVSYVHW